MAYGFTYTLPTITGSHTDFPVVLKTADFPTDALNGANQFLNGGGNLRAYTSSAKTTQLPVEIVSLVTGVSPDAEVWVKIPTAATGNTIYLEADSVAVSQPAVTDTYGRNAVWSDYDYACHADTGIGSTVDSSDGTVGTLSGTYAEGAAGQIGEAINFGEDRDSRLDTNKTVNGLSAFSLQAHIKFPSSVGSSTNEDAVFSAYATGNRNFLLRRDTQTSTYEFFTFTSSQVGGSFANTAITADEYHWLTATYDGSTMRVYVNSTESTTTFSQTGSTGESASPSSFWIGDYQASSQDDLRAFFDEGRVRTSAVDANWIATEVANHQSATAWGTVGSWSEVSGATYTIVIDQASYTTTANDTGLLFNRVFSAEQASYTTSAQDVGLLFNRALNSEAANYTTAAQDTSLLFNRALTSDSATYTTTANDVTLTYTPVVGATYTIVSEQATYTTQGQDAALKYNRILTLDVSTYTTTAQVVNLRYSADLWNVESPVVTSWTTEPGVATSWTPQTPADTTWTIQ